MSDFKPVLPFLRLEDVEKFIGIWGYVSSTRGVGGIIKEKFEDFMVWEVLVTGEDSRKVFEEGSFRDSSGLNILCVMKKVGVDSVRALTILAKILGLKPNSMGICGIKDKVSISWQYVSIPSRYIELNKTYRVGDILEVKPYKYIDFNLSSNVLKCNVFRITIRNLETLDSCIIEETLNQLKNEGIPNYFGHQRFGITRPVTHLVGKYIMKGMVREAVLEFLVDYSNMESLENREARMKLLEEWCLEWALRSFPKSLSYEKIIVRHLIQNPDDYIGAFRKIPLRLRRLMVEAVAAKIFNETLSRIVEKKMLGTLELGDLVLPVDMYGRLEKTTPIEVTRYNFKQVERMISKGRMKIVLPVPGYMVKIPSSSKGEIMVKVLEEEGVDLQDFKIKSFPEISTKGSYRSLTIVNWTSSIEEFGENHLTVKLSLPPGSYATVFLRELIKPTTPLSYIGRKSLHNHGKEDGYS